MAGRWHEQAGIDMFAMLRVCVFVNFTTTKRYHGSWGWGRFPAGRAAPWSKAGTAASAVRLSSPGGGPDGREDRHPGKKFGTAGQSSLPENGIRWRLMGGARVRGDRAPRLQRWRSGDCLFAFRRMLDRFGLSIYDQEGWALRLSQFAHSRQREFAGGV